MRSKEYKKAYLKEWHRKHPGYWKKYYYANQAKIAKRFKPYKKRWYKANQKEQYKKNRVRHLNKEYGLSWSEYLNLKKEAKGRCTICKIKANLHIDHCHRTKKTRGLLCRSCNVALGFFKDSVPLLFKAIGYLNRSKINVSLGNKAITKIYCGAPELQLDPVVHNLSERMGCPLPGQNQ